MALVLEEYVRTSDKFSEPIRMVARYVAGESARHAGMREVARQHLSRAYEEARSTPEPPIPVDAVECDYAILMIVSAVGDGDRPEALRWLRVLFDNPLARSPLGAAHLAQAVILTLEMCGPDELARETAIAVQALSDAAALDRHPDPANALRMTVCRTELLIATGDTTSLPALLPVLVGLARGAPPALEALVRRTLVGALAALGDLDGIRAELDRLTFLQDEAIGSTVRFDALPQVDHFLRAQLVAAAAAADAQDVGSAVEVIEQGGSGSCGDCGRASKVWKGRRRSPPTWSPPVSGVFWPLSPWRSRPPRSVSPSRTGDTSSTTSTPTRPWRPPIAWASSPTSSSTTTDCACSI